MMAQTESHVQHVYGIKTNPILIADDIRRVSTHMQMKQKKHKATFQSERNIHKATQSNGKSVI